MKSRSLFHRPEFTSSQKRDYFSQKALNFLQELRLLIRGGKLNRKPGEESWRNVVEHSLVQAIAAEKMSELLLQSDQLSSEDRQALQAGLLVQSAATHDYSKRYEVKREDFDYRDIKHMLDMWKRVRPNEQLIQATSPQFYIRALHHPKSIGLLEKLQFYLDNITTGSTIVPLLVRLEEVEARKPGLNSDPDLLRALNGQRFWDVGRQLGQQFEREFFTLLPKKVQEEIQEPAHLPFYLRQLIEEEISEEKSDAQSEELVA